MIIGSVKEQNKQETRVPLTPEVVQKLTTKGHLVLLQKNYGLNLNYSDTAYLNSGAKIIESPEQLINKSEILIQITPPQIKLIKYTNCQLLIADFTGVTLNFSPTKQLHLELVPRTSIAQSIDILSSQSIVRGYMAALYALYHTKRIASQIITAATTINPIRALVIGASTTGLEAAAFLKKFGCTVHLADIKEQAEELATSVGAKFTLLSNNHTIHSLLANKDIIIATATNAKNIIKTKDLSALTSNTILIDTTEQNIKFSKSRINFHFYRNTHFERMAPLTASDLFAHNILNLINIIFPTPISLDLSADYLKPMLHN